MNEYDIVIGIRDGKPYLLKNRWGPESGPSPILSNIITIDTIAHTVTFMHKAPWWQAIWNNFRFKIGMKVGF